MKKLAVIYHSAHGHTERFAQHVLEGAQTVPHVEASILNVEQISAPQTLVEFDGLIWGSPTYLGGVSGPFKSFMDSTGALWKQQHLKGKLAAGFTVSSFPSGDKLTTLLSMLIFSMQHGMIWVGNPLTHNGTSPAQAINSLGSWTGAMAQAAHNTAAADAFSPGDLKTAELFGRNFAETLIRT